MSKQFLFTLALAFTAAAAQASNYPPDYGHQKVYAVAKGPAVFVTVSSGMGSASVVGYKFTGPLRNESGLDAVIETTCQLNDGTVEFKRSVLKLGPEYHGTGYMSAPYHPADFLPADCRLSYTWTLRFAFSDSHGNWDNNNRENSAYSYSETTSGAPGVETFFTHQNGDSGGSGINLKAWAFIIDFMKR